MPKKESDYVIFHAPHIGFATAMLGKDPVTATDGYGGWQVVARPRRKGITVFQGSNPIKMQVPVLFDGYTTRDSQEIEIMRLSRMALPRGHEPPIITVSGRGVPSLGPKRWVIESIDWGTDVIWGTSKGGSLTRLRQDGVVHLIEYVDEARVAFKNLNPASGSWPKHHTVKKGDTLPKLAKSFYHNSKKWKLIASANSIRDPRHLKLGKILIIPYPG